MVKSFLLANSGIAMPGIGLGTWKSEPGVVGEAVKTAILDCGYRHIDCAQIYGNQVEIGHALKEIFDDPNNGIERNDLFICSKLWNHDHAPSDVEPAIQKILKELQVEYIDLFLMHWPVAGKKDGEAFTVDSLVSLEDCPLVDTYKAMEECQRKGYTKAIGVSNFSIKKLKDLLADESVQIKPAVNQIELHPYLQMNEMVEFCAANNIHVTAYSPLGSGDRPAGLGTSHLPPLLENETIQAVAKTKNVTPAQLILAYALQRGLSVLPKSTSKARILQNIQTASVVGELTTDEMKQLASLDKHQRYVDGKFWCMEGSPYTVEELWDE